VAPRLPEYGVLVVPHRTPLSTAEVYREADRLGLARSATELDAARARLAAAFEPGLVVNDLQPAALSLAPTVAGALDAATTAGADEAIVCGSGPTIIGLFWGADGPRRARDAAAALHGRGFSAAVAADPVRGGDRTTTANE
jgi:4-diphosphocytidyl-2-C-methyl-D-erythritol kinase